MQTPLHSLRHVSVWLEDGPSDGSIFTQAMDWAFRLNLPLRAIVKSPRSPSDASKVGTKSLDLGAACAQRGIALELFLWPGDGDAGLRQFLCPHGLCVFMARPDASVADELWQRAARCYENALVVCSAACSPLTRILVLYDQGQASAGYLENVVCFCSALAIRPIILIVAQTEHEAHFRRGFAEGICTSLGLAADIDLIVGCAAPVAASRVATWRNCTHVIVERHQTASRWHALPVDLHDYRPLLSCFSLLALPPASVADVPTWLRADRGASAGPLPVHEARTRVEMRTLYRGVS